jgi:putative endonuclease
VPVKLTSAETGSIAENAVCALLQEKHYKILRRNYLVPCVGELDIIAAKQGRLLFVEVKGRSQVSRGSCQNIHSSSDNFGGPFAALTAKKRLRLRRAAEHYLQRQPEMNDEIVFLAAAVLLNNQGSVQEIRFEPVEFA